MPALRPGLAAFTVLDTAALARTVLSAAEVPDCRLATLADVLRREDEPCHRALADARATADVLQGLLGRLAGAGVLTLAGVQPLIPVATRGPGGTLTPARRATARNAERDSQQAR